MPRKPHTALAPFGSRLRVLPLVAAATAFGLGIESSIRFGVEEVAEYWAYAAIGAGCAGLLLFALYRDEGLRLGRLFRIACLCLAFAGLGARAIGVHTETGFYKLALRTGKDRSAITAWTGTVTKPGQLSTSGREWTVVEARQALLGGRWVPVAGLVRVSRDPAAGKLACRGRVFQAGHEVLLAGAPTPVPERDKATGPPFNRMLRNKGILLKTFISKDEGGRLHILRKGHPYSPQNLAARTAAWTTRTLHRYLGHGQEAAVAAALTVGDKQDIDGETRAAYATAGTLHILAVSGMHVGLIYQLLLAVGVLLPLWMQGLRRRNLSIAVMLLLWAFAFVTGLQASIVRAVVMFCLIEVGRLQGRSARPMDMLALAGLLMLAAAPNQLYDLGFQLSFAAMAGIFLFYQPLESIFKIKNASLRYTWQAACLTLAAQAGATPVSLFHFHQFPTYFLPVNIPAVWLSAVGLYGCLGVLAFAWWPWLAGILAWVVKGVLGLTNAIMFGAAALPAALIQHVYLGAAACLAFGAALLLVLTWLAHPERRWRLWGSVAMLLVLGGLTSWRHLPGRQRDGILLLSEDGRLTACAVRSGTVFLPDSAQDLSRYLIDQNLKQARGAALPLRSLPVLAGIGVPETKQPGVSPDSRETLIKASLLLAGTQLFHLEEWIQARRAEHVLVAGLWRAATKEKYQLQARRHGCSVQFLEDEGALFLEERREVSAPRTDARGTDKADSHNKPHPEEP